MEEEKAIELAEEFTKMDFSNPMGWTGYYDTELNELSQAVQTVLNMLKEKDKEISNLKIEIDEAWEEWNNLERGSYEEKTRLKDEIKKKDKKIEKLKKESEHWKNAFERELEDNRKNTCELLKQDLIIRKKYRQIEEKDNRIRNLEKETQGYFETTIIQSEQFSEENIKKDKIIDLMTEHIVSSAIVDDTVCAIKCDCETDIEEDCTHEKMLNCTKQYFERKATNDG